MTRPFDFDVDALRAASEAGSAPVIVDTRCRWEYAADHIPGATHLPFWTIARRHRELGVCTDTPILLYCGHGPRAMWARRALRRIGYRRVGLLRGHFRAWKLSR